MLGKTGCYLCVSGHCADASEMAGNGIAKLANSRSINYCCGSALDGDYT